MAPGRKATFKVEATGDCLKFKWQKDRKIDLSDDEKCYDTDTDTLHIGEVEKGDKGRYRCRVSNYITEIFSKEAVLTVSKLVMCVFYALAFKPTPSFPICMVLVMKSTLMSGIHCTCLLIHHYKLPFCSPSQST